MHKPRQSSGLEHGPQTSGKMGSPPELELLVSLVVSPSVDDDDDSAPPVAEDELELELELDSPLELTGAALPPVEPTSSGGTHSPAVCGFPSSP